MPIRGHFVMDPLDAAYATKEWLKPKFVIPMHYGTTPVLKGTPQEYMTALGQTSTKVFPINPGDKLEFYRGVALSGDDRRPPAAAPPALGRARRADRGAEDRAGALRGDPGSDRGGRDGRRDPLDAPGGLRATDPPLRGIPRPVVVSGGGPRARASRPSAEDLCGQTTGCRHRLGQRRPQLRAQASC